MTGEQFDVYLSGAVAGYAEEHIKNGDWSEQEGLEKSRGEFAGLLPNGLASAGQYLYSVVDEDSGESVGILWYADRERAGKPYAFIYDVEIRPEFRRKGYGAQALAALDEVVKARGIGEIMLHVFGSNKTARDLYERSGYQAANVLMVKKLG
jgi:ribosomal protein S18 acetylase RimI-like enzyme